MKKYVPITKQTKAGRAGKQIKCKACSTIARRVYHLNWKSCKCIICNQTFEKFDWLIEESIYL